MGAATKADLEALVKRLERSLERSEARNMALGKSRDRAMAKNKALSKSVVEGRERERATAQILRVIGRSSTDAQPVFDAIANAALRLIGGISAAVTRLHGDKLHLAAVTSTSNTADERLKAQFPNPVSKFPWHARAIRFRVPYCVSDTEKTAALRDRARARGYRSAIFVPLLSGKLPIGTIGVSRRNPGSFTDHDIELLQTFADQAVIAIENVRLFNETKEALERQTATADVLKVISISPTDVQPVLDTIAESAARLCESPNGVIFRRDGDRLVLVAQRGSIPLGPIGEFTLPLDRGNVPGRSIMDGQMVHVADLQAESGEFPEGSELARRFGVRTVLNVPLMREGVAIGVIGVGRTEVAQLFSDRQVELLKTFADQAVIAIENVRLFKELQARNAEISEALEQQTATSELLKVIGQSTFELQPVFETLVENARRLCEAERAFVCRFDGRLLRGVATHNVSPELRTFVEENPFPVGRHSVMARAGLERRTVHIHDVQADQEITYGGNFVEPVRTALAVPMLRGEELLGGIMVYRHEVRPFADSHISLLETFADQAAIAIENARLLTELQARTTALSRSVDQLTALGEVGQAVSSSLDLETVLTTIVSRAVQLSGLDGGVIFEYDEAAQEFTQRAATDPGSALTEARRTTRIGKGEGVVGRTAVTFDPVQVHDISMAGAYEGRLRESLIGAGVRAVLAVPMLRESHLIGCLAVTRNAPGAFPSEAIELLRTFATQSALAIQNARLFREIEEKSRQLEIANQHKSEFLANMSHELRTPLNAVIGFSEVLQQGMVGELNEKQSEYTNYIHTSGSHLLSLINDILDLSKVEAGRMELDVAAFSVPMAIDNALTLIKERATRHGLALECSLDPAVADISADERKFKQILLNLLSNAVKFTPEGGKITVAARPLNDAVEVSVTDTGIGIAPEDCDAVFEEFQQVGDSAERKAEGTGLGLALTKKFIELHGGRIWLTSTIGQGSTFVFTLPNSQPKAQTVPDK